MRPRRIPACLPLFLLLALSGCKAPPPFETFMPRMLDLVVPEQHERFSREYAGHIIAGEFESARSMVPAERFCTADMRGVRFNQQQAPRNELTCTDTPSAIAAALDVVPRETPKAVQVVNYHASREHGALAVTIEQEFVYEDIVLRVAMDYERDGDNRRVTKTVLAIDDTTWFGRIDQALAAMPFNIVWWLIGLQLAAYFAVPVIVFWIVRRQRRKTNDDDAHLAA